MSIQFEWKMLAMRVVLPVVLAVGLMIVLSGLSGCDSWGNGNGLRVSTKRGRDGIIDDRQTVALVNGKAISRRELVGILLADKGRGVLDMMTALEIVRQYAADKGIDLTPAMVEKQKQAILQDMAPGKPRDVQQGLLDYMLSRQGLSEQEFMLVVKKQALLRRLIDKKTIKVTQKQIARIYEQYYGKKVVVRELVVGSFRKIQRIRNELGVDLSFADAVSKYSEDQKSLARDGIVGPFSRVDSTVPEQVRQEAFKLTKVGSHSGVFCYYSKDNHQWWCMLELEQVVPASNVTLAKVRDELIKKVQNVEMIRKMNELEQRLKKQAHVIILDTRLL